MESNQETQNRRENLLADFTKDIRFSERCTKRYHVTAFLLLLLAITASGVAGILGLTEVLTAKWVGAIALLPPLLVLLERSFKFEGRGRWHKRKKNRLEDLRDQLIYQNPVEPNLDQIAAINKKKHKLNHEMQMEWDEELSLSWAGIQHGPRETHGPPPELPPRR